MEHLRRLFSLGVGVPRILLPSAGIDLHKWAVVACDQYTSQPEYWTEVEALVGDAPSTLRMIFPEIYLSEGSGRIERIHSEMENALSGGVLAPAREGWMLVRRDTESGSRLGLVLTVDLEKYDFLPDSDTPIRPTEGTILSRIPPRVAIREGGALELPHIMLLADDPQYTLIEPIYAKRDALQPCYDIPLMMRGGRLRGWFVPPDLLDGFADALEALWSDGNGLLFAVGDGNHSLATARQCWLNLRDTLDDTQRETHPARFAMTELVNLHDPALRFEPIHRVLFGVPPQETIDRFLQTANDTGLRPVLRAPGRGEDGLCFCWAEEECALAFTGRGDAMPLEVLQAFLDEVAASRDDADLDYIHGEAALRELSSRPHALGVLLRGMEKDALFPEIRENGVLPRKAFSMGDAHEKRYYMEARKILP